MSGRGRQPRRGLLRLLGLDRRRAASDREAPRDRPVLGRSAELDREIRHHVLERAELLRAEGWEREAALVEAERRFGDAERIRLEMARADGEAGKGAEAMRSVAADLRYAVRGLRANPSFAAAVVATLALGIGAAASIFAVVDALLIRPLPYADADRWVQVHQASEGGYGLGLPNERIAALREVSDGPFDAWVMHRRQGLARVDGPRAEGLNVVAVTPEADRLLGIPLLMGRGFTTEDAAPGAPPVAILTRRYWERLGADPDVIGRTFRTESGPVTVVGVLRGGIKFPPWGPPQDLWLPLRDDFTMADRDVRTIQGVWARLPLGTSTALAQERADALTASLSQQEPSEGPWAVRLLPTGEFRANPDERQAFWMLGATVLTIFLIALVNGVNLLLVRATARTREMAVRTAIGASRRRLLRQFLAEGLVLGGLGGAAALVLAWGAVALMRGMMPYEVVYFSPHAFEVEGRTLAFSFAVSVLVGVTLGLLPAVQLLRRGGGTAGLSGTRPGEEPPARRRVRNGLVVAQVALSMTLLVGAGLLVNGFVRLLSVDPGFDVDRVAIAILTASPTRYPDGAARAELVRRLEGALEARPETDAVTMSTGTGFSFGVTLEAEGRPVPETQPYIVPHSAVSADYFETMGVPLLAGRGFNASDSGTDNVVIDRDLARFLWGREDPVGRRFRLDSDSPWMTVVGVIAELRMMGRDQRDGPGQYLRARNPESAGSWVEIGMRTSGPPEALLPVSEETLRAVDPEQAYFRLRTGAQALAEEEETPRFLVTLMSLLAAVAVTLAAVGLYGVLAYSVARRDRELGVRMALGAGRARVRAMVLREGMGVAVLGVALGLVGSVWLARTVEALLYEVEPNDGLTLALTAALLLCVASFAAFLPARRATRVDPVEVLRAE